MKKQFIFILGLLFMTLMQNSKANTDTTEMMLQITNIDHARGGNIIVYIFEKDGFPKKHDKAILTQTKSADASSLTFTFAIKPEVIAVKVLHDEDMDGKVTKNWSGIYPKEGLGFTNKQKVSFTGPPKYRKSKVTKESYKNGLTISIIYP